MSGDRWWGLGHDVRCVMCGDRVWVRVIRYGMCRGQGLGARRAVLGVRGTVCTSDDRRGGGDVRQGLRCDTSDQVTRLSIHCVEVLSGRSK
jgi:hypothetical protein